MDTISLGFTGLFLLTFLSATILPILSEAFLLAMLAKGFDPMTCLTISTIGNSLGGITNYGIGKLGKCISPKERSTSTMSLTNIVLSSQSFGNLDAISS